MLQKWSNSTILKCSELNTLKEQIENYIPLEFDGLGIALNQCN